MSDTPVNSLNDQAGKKGTPVLLIVITVILVCALAFIIFSYFGQKKKMIEMETVLTHEKDSLANELRLLAHGYDTLRTSNDTLNAKLQKEKSRILKLLTINASNVQLIKTYKGEITTMREIMKSYIVQIDSLNTKNRLLAAENQDIKEQITTVKNTNVELSKAKEELSSKVEIASIIQAKNVVVKVFGVSEEDVTHDMRRRAKVINFGILYGMGVNALKNNLGTDRKEAQIFYDNYFAQFPTIAAYLESIKNFAKQNGYTETLFGRKRYFPGIKSPIQFIRAMAERMATNAPIQGTATADIIKIGMKKADSALRNAGLIKEVRLVLQVHDELVYEIKKDKLSEAQRIIEDAMKDVIPDEFLKGKEKVPLLVSTSYGKTWGDLK